jgi:hypothetical protein
MKLLNVCLAAVVTTLLVSHVRAACDVNATYEVFHSVNVNYVLCLGQKDLATCMSEMAAECDMEGGIQCVSTLDDQTHLTYCYPSDCSAFQIQTFLGVPTTCLNEVTTMPTNSTTMPANSTTMATNSTTMAASTIKPASAFGFESRNVLLNTFGILLAVALAMKLAI